MTSSGSESKMSLNENMAHSTATSSMISLTSMNSSTLTQGLREADLGDKDLVTKTDTDRNEVVFCLTRTSMVNNRQLMSAIQHLNPEYTIANNEQDLLIYAENRQKYFFVCDTFSGALFTTLRKKACRICGPPLLVYIHNKQMSIPDTHRPVFNGSMLGVAVCFTGFAKKRDVLGELVDMVHFMGAMVRKEVSGDVTHVIANSAKGQKYKAAVNLGKNIMTEKWVTEAWENRLDTNFKATQTSFAEQFQLKPFEGLKLAFLGFPRDEIEHMQETTVQNGGQYFDVGTPGCTHLVIEDNYQSDLPSEVSQAPHVVKQEWFWRCIQLDACAEESLYCFLDHKGTPSGIEPRARKKRKHLNASHDLIDLLSPNSPFANKRRRTKDRLSACSRNFDSSLGSCSSALDSPELPKTTFVRKPLTARNQTCLELLQTERNYVRVLQMIIKNFKEPLEQSRDERGGALLAPEEIKRIFGGLPHLLAVHEVLLKSLDSLVNDWNEEQLIGKVIVDCADGMMKAYPNFINYFDMIKEMIAKLDKERPRFHAFLKICQNNPDLGRQRLTDLLIRPVQRLPSICLLLKDMLKHTPDSNPDHQCLLKALQIVEKVLTFVNEDKRKTEHQFQMFDVIRGIDNCPPYILSAHRTLVSKAEVQEYDEAGGGATKNDNLQIFLFNDSMEIAKRRNKVLNAMASGSKYSGQVKPYKHVEFIKLSLLKSIVDIKDGGECYDMFGLMYYSSNANKDILSIYKLLGGVTKEDWIAKVMECLSETKCNADSENYLVSADIKDFTTHKERTGYIDKVIGKTKKVAKALTPSRLHQQASTPLRRAVSSIIHSFGDDDESFATPTTPRLRPSESRYSLMEMLPWKERTPTTPRLKPSESRYSLMEMLPSWKEKTRTSPRLKSSQSRYSLMEMLPWKEKK